MTKSDKTMDSDQNTIPSETVENIKPNLSKIPKNPWNLTKTHTQRDGSHEIYEILLFLRNIQNR